ncbi:MAG: hypothetical protein EZS28_052365 [Streblomastix strix]|uniref:Uncharacterized protein n=1 Tax=Streblomastix strix TaxID=222440 RepID=A0A5J4S9K7_9EUKA|nr:MAG: hypothetical protein EZS28_052365 [Streblomastix strix]
MAIKPNSSKNENEDESLNFQVYPVLPVGVKLPTEEEQKAAVEKYCQDMEGSTIGPQFISDTKVEYPKFLTDE